MRLFGSLALAATLALVGAPAHAQDAHGAVPAAPAAQPSVTDTSSAATASAAAAAVGTAEQRGEAQTTVAEVAAQGHAATPAQAVDIITPHITDAPHFEYPCLSGDYAILTCEGHLPTGWIVPVGSYQLDLSPTKHVLMMLLASALACLVLIGAARAHKRHSHAAGHPKGFAAGIEALVLYIRDEVALKNLGHHGEKYVPFILTLFFFILFANLLGLIPYGSTATGNISVTAALAVLTFVVVEIAGMRAQGAGYLNTIFYWNKDLPIFMRVPMFLIMTPIEIVGKIAKPFALAIRLFANMTAGHIVVLALIGLIFLFRGPASTAPFLAASAIMVLELFVAFLQAFIFALLSSVFIGQIREAHH
ncbi:F0F1 ATP synthase subunit A [Roseisolibacter sp. H3M3-2]|uniref:F0F1 ATP synthase subunit A n=1 Tax=Roseisolibacter sp. H3M3-2 TaxID=3031323 RepID=UPI0023DA36EF|nr:F0F1 ATP synthase subunit A [Roseisolibacter sp. H3M3-2]MDF1501433.1 F0F1 ATP synthase subunit A [Roseisolibacter sp. H3M3-2]